MEWNRVISTNVYAIALNGHDIYIKFKTGETYRFFSAGLLFNDLLSSHNIEMYLEENMNDFYEYEEVQL